MSAAMRVLDRIVLAALQVLLLALPLFLGGRQTVAAERKPSAGQAEPVPVQLSAVSQTPFTGRQTVDDGR